MVDKLPRLGVVQDWTGFEAAGEQLEWRAERVAHNQAGVRVSVQVTNTRTGKSTAMVFRKDMRPTVDNAMMAATTCEAGSGDSAAPSVDDDEPSV